MKTKMYVKEIIRGVETIRVENDVKGNPRYVMHYLTFINLAEKFASHEEEYQTALKRARKFGGKIYRAKWYGGGFVFQSYNIGGKIDAIITQRELGWDR